MTISGTYVVEELANTIIPIFEGTHSNKGYCIGETIPSANGNVDKSELEQ